MARQPFLDQTADLQRERERRRPCSPLTSGAARSRTARRKSSACRRSFVGALERLLGLFDPGGSLAHVTQALPLQVGRHVDIVPEHAQFPYRRWLTRLADTLAMQPSANSMRALAMSMRP